MERTTWVSTADLENRRAFLAQLQALLLQAKDVTRGGQRGGLRDIQLGLEKWLMEVGAPSPSLCPPQPETSEDTCSNADCKNNGNGNVGNIENVGTDFASASLNDLQPILAAPKDELSSFAMDMCSSASGAPSCGLADNTVTFSSSFKNLNLEDIAEFLQLFFAGGLQEIVKLRSIGRNVARLVIVRCFSIIACALEEVVQKLYGLSFESAKANLDFKIDANGCTSVSFFVCIARDIRVSTDAVMKCLEHLTVYTDTFSMRFATQVCVDILKQLRQCVSFLLQRLLCGELQRVHTSKNVVTELNLNLQDETKLKQMAEGRVKELRHIMGPSLLTSIEHMMILVRPTVQYLMSVLSFKDIRGSNEELSLWTDVSANLFGLARWVASTSWPKRPKSKISLTDSVANERDKDAFLGRSSNSDMIQFGLASDIDNTATANPLWRRFAHIVVESLLPVAFSPEYISCVAQHCGDQNEGQLLALRLFSDTIKGLTDTNIAELQYVLRYPKWKKRIVEGILYTIVSPQPAVLEAGLDTLQRIVVSCVDVLGSEIGFVYTSCLFGLLESDNTPSVMRRLLIKHVVSTFFKSSSGVSGSPSLLLRLYHHFDLNVSWHQLNVIQQAFATLSKAVRCAASEDFSKTCLSKEGGDQDSAVPQKSIPFLALQGLSLAAGQLAIHVPQDYQAAAELKNLPNMSNREKKMEEQRVVDIINGSPFKGFKKLFDITDEEMNPTGCKKIAMENNWAHQHIPPPATAEVEAKVRRIAHFIMTTPSLNPEASADFLSSPAILPLQVCQVVMKKLSLAGKGLLEGLKELFDIVRLPKEGQRIERLLEFFCSAYFEANYVIGIDDEVFPFESENACFIVGVAVLMLNTNLHNPHVSFARMKASTFHAQLQRCNEGKDLSERFAKSLFDKVSADLFSGIEGFPSTGINSEVRYANVPSLGNMDSIFLTTEERRELAFGVVRQRLVSETRKLIYRCSRIEGKVAEKPPLFWFGVTRDLFFNVWPSLCPVFGIAVDGARVPEDVLALCVMGLRSSLIAAAAFCMHTEAGASQVALLRIASFEPIRDGCHKSILDVAASPHSFYFSVQCWMQVAKLLIDVRKSQKQRLVVEAESVYGRIEEFTRKSCVKSNEETSSDVLFSFKGVVQDILKGIVAVVQDTSIDVATFSAALYVLQRALGYSLISHDSQQVVATVTNFINVRDFSHLVVPALVDVIKSHSGESDGCLRLVVEFVVDTLYAIWNSCVCNIGPQCVVSRSELTNCYSFFQQCYEHCEASAEVLMHLLQGVKELIAQTLHSVGAAFADDLGPPSHTLHTMAHMWQRLLQPVTCALFDKDSVGTETCGIAVHVLRKLVVLCCGVVGGAPAVIALQRNVRNILLLLLSNTSYIGCMCGDVDSAQMCLSQLSAICMTVLRCQDTMVGCGDDMHCNCLEGEQEPTKNTWLSDSPFLHRLVKGIQEGSDAFVFHLLELIGLLLLCQSQQIRTEAITVMRLLVVKVKPCYLRHLSVRLSTVLLEASFGHVTAGHEPSVANSCYASYTLLDLQAPPTMRICSPTSFRTTLPEILKFMSNDLLSAASADHVNFIVGVVMKHSTVPLAVSPHSSFQVCATAVRALMQCASQCATRQGIDSSTAAFYLGVVTECVSLVLLALRIPVCLIVPDSANYAGRRWVMEKRSTALAAYVADGADAIEALCIGAVSKASGGFSGSACRSQAKSNANLESGESDRTARSGRLSSYGDALTDEQLTEYCTLMAQLLSPLPKVLGAFLKHTGVAKKEGGCAMPQPDNNDCLLWTPPSADQYVLAELLLEAAGTFLAILWRVNHVGEMESFIAGSAQQGRDAPPMRKSQALLPHVAIRGGLNAFMELSLWMNIAEFRSVILEIFQITLNLQKVTLTTREAQKILDRTTESLAVQRLSPLEQQHICSCNVGMYQELSTIVAHWVKNIVRQTDATLSDLSDEQQEELRNVAKGNDVFLGLSRLLAPTAGSIILPIREYFEWYISPCHKLEGDSSEKESTVCTATP